MPDPRGCSIDAVMQVLGTPAPPGDHPRRAILDVLADGVKSPAPLAAMRQAAGTDMNELLAKALEAHSGRCQVVEYVGA